MEISFNWTDHVSLFFEGLIDSNIWLNQQHWWKCVNNLNIGAGGLGTVPARARPGCFSVQQCIQQYFTLLVVMRKCILFPPLRQWKQAVMSLLPPLSPQKEDVCFSQLSVDLNVLTWSDNYGNITAPWLFPVTHCWPLQAVWCNSTAFFSAFVLNQTDN